MKLDEAKGDQWDEMAKVYEKLTAGTAVKPIRTMLKGLDKRWPFSKAEGVLDNGCGPGPIMARILKDYAIPESCSLTCSDFSDAMIEMANAKKAEAIEADSKSPWSRVEAMKQDAMNLERIKDASQSHITAGWVYFATSDPQKCLSESKRVLKDGGVLACSSWHGSQWIDLMSLLPTIRPDKQLPEIPENWKHAEPMKLELEKAGFRAVESQEVQVEMSVDSLELFVDFMLDKMPHMIMLLKDFSDDEKARLRKLMLDEGRKMCPQDPPTFTGTALVAVGTK